jgi:hypothetical protein
MSALMSRTRAVAVLASAMIVAAAVGGAPGTAEARPSANGPWVVKVRPADSVVAGLRTAGTPTLARVIAAWGPPLRLSEPGWSAGSGNGCVGTWRRPAARVEFVNYGSRPAGATSCSPAYGRVQEITTLGSRWRTDRALRVGGRASAVVAAFPGARATTWAGRRAWLLIPRTVTCLGACDDPTVTISNVTALMGGGRVRQFVVGVGAGGE